MLIRSENGAAHQICRLVLELLSVFNVSPSVEAHDGLVFFEADATSRRDISVRQRMQEALHGSDCVHKWRDAVDDDAEGEIFEFGRSQQRSPPAF
jgi:hypothetical protein